MTGRVLSFVVFVAIVAAFFYDTLLGIRVVGLAEIGYGVYWIRVGKIPYGWRGMEPSGYLTGWAALMVGLLACGLGVLLLVAPAAVQPFFCGKRGCT